MNPKTISAVASAAITATASCAVLMIGPADAATGQCASTPDALSGPIGCGAIFLSQLGGGPNGYALALTVPDDTFNAPVTVQPYDGHPDQDFTLYQVCDGMSYSQSEQHPCGNGTPRTHAFVIQFTPDGAQPAGGLNSSQDHCITGYGGKVVLGMCDGNLRAWYWAGIPEGQNGNGIPPAVTHADPAQTWTLRYAGSGAELVNGYSGQVIDDPSYGGPGTPLITWPGHHSVNEVMKISGCTNPIAETGPAWYGCVS